MFGFGRNKRREKKDRLDRAVSRALDRYDDEIDGFGGVLGRPRRLPPRLRPRGYLMDDDYDYYDYHRSPVPYYGIGTYWAGWLGFNPLWEPHMGWMDDWHYSIWRRYQFWLHNMDVMSLTAERRREWLVKRVLWRKPNMARRDALETADNLLGMTESLGADSDGRIDIEETETTTITTESTAVTVTQNQRATAANQLLQSLTTQGAQVPMAAAKQMANDIREGRQDKLLKQCLACSPTAGDNQFSFMATELATELMERHPPPPPQSSSKQPSQTKQIDDQEWSDDSSEETTTTTTTTAVFQHSYPGHNYGSNMSQFPAQSQRYSPEPGSQYPQRSRFQELPDSPQKRALPSTQQQLPIADFNKLNIQGQSKIAQFDGKLPEHGISTIRSKGKSKASSIPANFYQENYPVTAQPSKKFSVPKMKSLASSDKASILSAMPDPQPSSLATLKSSQKSSMFKKDPSTRKHPSYPKLEGKDRKAIGAPQMLGLQDYMQSPIQQQMYHRLDQQIMPFGSSLMQLEKKEKKHKSEKRDKGIKANKEKRHGK